MRTAPFLPLIACLSFTTLALAQAGTTKDLTQLLQSNENLTEFTTLLTSYGDIYANLSFQSDVTILAPNNEAFNKIPYSSLGPAFENNQSQIVRAVLQYHILPGRHPAAAYNGSFSFDKTWLQHSNYTNVTGGQVVGGVQQAGNVNVFTSGLGTRSTLDLPFTGGIVHVIDNFLIPPQNFVQNYRDPTSVASLPPVTPFHTLTPLNPFAASHSSLADYANTHKDLTIFVPRNAAFQALGLTLQSMPPAQLQRILNYHIVNSSTVAYSANLPNGTILRTHAGQNLTITFASNSLFVNQARVLQQDLLLSNGVMHVLDNFLDPEAPSVTANPEVPTMAPLLRGTSLSENVVPFTSFLPTSVTSFDTGTATPTSSFGVSDIGKGTSAFSRTTTSKRPSSTSKEKSAGRRLEWQRATMTMNGGLLAALCWMIGFL
ncbi:MAG: hypothetical protein L6R40_002205 [Gallowayella cf. fulva]|nr:MAG: hypothetical protein L6R40_002205 [Xanthomendoza cf. fulva]